MAREPKRLEFSGTDPLAELTNTIEILDADAVESVELVVHTSPEPETAPRPPSGDSRDGWERAGEKPGNIRANTHQHVALVSLAWYIEDRDTDSATRQDVAETPWCPLTETQVGNALGSLFRNKAAVQRRWVSHPDHDGGIYTYRPTDHGRAEVDRLAEWDDDAVESTTDESDEDGGGDDAGN